MPHTNPLLIGHGFPAFDRIQPDHIQSAVDAFLVQCRQYLSEIESLPEPTWDQIAESMEKIDLLFEYGWSPVGHLLSVANTEELRTAHEAAMPAVVDFGLNLRQSDSLYRACCRIRDSDQWQTLCDAQRRIILRSIQSAELAGIALQGSERERFNVIEQRLSQLATSFSNHLLDATKAFSCDISDPGAVDGIPLSLRRRMAAAWSASAEHKDHPPATAESGPWRVTLDAPTFGPFMEHCRDASLREKIYRAYITRASDGPFSNCELITEILTLRRKQAQLLGFSSYADLSLSRKMAGTVQTVQQMFEQLLAASYESARQELQLLTEFAVRQGNTRELAHWDIAFWAERLRESLFQFTDEQLRPYFSFERVLDGLFGVCHELFGIKVKPADGKAPVWNADVRYFEIYNESDDLIAGFYLDPFSRPENKRGGAWMGDCIARSFNEHHARLPVAHLICNSTPPVDDIPSLMTFREVETLFHEFGHGLQHMLTTVDFRDASGITGVEWDAVELPSQFMENWCYHRPTLMSMAIHYQTGEPLPEDLFQKLCRARTFRAATQMLRQLQLGMTDLELHAKYVPGGEETPFDVERRVQQKTSLLPPLPENRFLCSFQHIFAGGYAAGYYSYKWAEVLSADAFAAFEEAGLENPQALAETGRRFRDTVLAQGGSRHPMEIFQDFRGRQPDPAALLRQNGLLPAAT
jgi:oligopeptidase A